MILLLVSFPVLLNQIEQWSNAWGEPAFSLREGKVLAAGRALEPPVELDRDFSPPKSAKVVPLVDWSEVFGVANNSPIEPVVSVWKLLEIS